MSQDVDDDCVVECPHSPQSARYDTSPCAPSVGVGIADCQQSQGRSPAFTVNHLIHCSTDFNRYLDI